MNYHKAKHRSPLKKLFHNAVEPQRGIFEVGDQKLNVGDRMSVFHRLVTSDFSAVGTEYKS